MLSYSLTHKLLDSMRASVFSLFHVKVVQSPVLSFTMAMTDPSTSALNVSRVDTQADSEGSPQLASEYLSNVNCSTIDVNLLSAANTINKSDEVSTPHPLCIQLMHFRRRKQAKRKAPDSDSINYKAERVLKLHRTDETQSEPLTPGLHSPVIQHQISTVTVDPVFNETQLQSTQELTNEQTESLSPCSPTAIMTESLTDGIQQHFCSECRKIQSASAFYPSYLERRKYTCKQCSYQRHHATQCKQLHQLQPKSDEASNMVERFRRHCAKTYIPSNWHGASGPSRMYSRFHPTTVTGLRLNFGAKIARMLLQFWQHKSALALDDHIGSIDTRPRRHELNSEQLATNEYIQTAPGSDTNKAFDTATAISTASTALKADTNLSDPGTAQEKSLRTSKARRSPLVFLLWGKNDVWAVEPWQCIPVTRQEAAAFRKVPMSMRADLLLPELAIKVDQKLYELYLLCTNHKSNSCSTE